MKTGFYIGRFQPFHLGHLSAIRQALETVDRLIIGIGSSQYTGKPRNPFSCDERRKWIERALDEAGIPEERYGIELIPDISDDDSWPRHVSLMTPPFSEVFVGEEDLVKTLFEKHTDIPVTLVRKELDISATEIRRRMKEGDDWKSMLPESVSRAMDESDAVIRLMKIGD